MSSILSLPPELILSILECGGPSIHFPCALACRQLFSIIRGLLKYHRKCYGLYHTPSDLLPLTILGLLRTALRDPIAAWHIRDLEVWHIRSIWADWLTYYPCEVDILHPDPHTVVADYREAGRSGRMYRESELMHYRNIMREELYFDEDVVEELSRRILKGDDQPIKMLLLTVVPRLRSVKSMAIWELSSLTRTNPAVQDSQLEFLTRVAKTLDKREVSLDFWPVGLRSIQSITVGLKPSRSLEGALEGGMHQMFGLYGAQQLFALPSLKELFVANMKPIMPSQTYTLRHYVRPSLLEKVCLSGTLDSFGTVSQSESFKAWLANATALKAFHLQCQATTGDALLEILIEHHAHSLQSLEMTCSLQTTIMRQSRLQRFHNLRHIAIDIEWLVYDTRVCCQSHHHTSFKGGFLELLQSKTLADILPPSTVTVSFFSQNKDIQDINKIWHHAMDNLVASTIQQRSLPNLKAVFLGKLLGPDTKMQWPESRCASSTGGVEVFGLETHDQRYISGRVHALGIDKFSSATDVVTFPRRDLQAWNRITTNAATASLLCRVIRMSKEPTHRSGGRGHFPSL